MGGTRSARRTRGGVGALALALAWSCGADPVQAPPEQSEPLAVEQPAAPTPVVVPERWEVPFEDPAPPAELGAAHPRYAALRPAEQQILAKVLNAVPAACEPCAGKPLARCGVAPPPGCENVPRLMDRAFRLAEAGAPPAQIQAAVSYADIWQAPPSDPPVRGPVRVEVWVDLASPFTGPTLHTLGKLPTDTVGLVVRFFPDPAVPHSEALAAAALAAGQQGRLQPFMAAAEGWREGNRDARRTGHDPFADGGIEAVAASLAGQGLDLERWEADRISAAVTGRLSQDRALAEALGVRAVPTWFVDGYRLRGSQSDLALGRLIGLALDDQQAAKE